MKGQTTIIVALIVAVLVFLYIKMKSNSSKEIRANKAERARAREDVIALNLQREIAATKRNEAIRARQWKFING